MLVVVAVTTTKAVVTVAVALLVEEQAPGADALIRLNENIAWLFVKGKRETRT